MCFRLNQSRLPLEKCVIKSHGRTEAQNFVKESEKASKSCKGQCRNRYCNISTRYFGYIKLCVQLTARCQKKKLD